MSTMHNHTQALPLVLAEQQQSCPAHLAGAPLHAELCVHHCCRLLEEGRRCVDCKGIDVQYIMRLHAVEHSCEDECTRTCCHRWPSGSMRHQVTTEHLQVVPVLLSIASWPGQCSSMAVST